MLPESLENKLHQVTEASRKAHQVPEVQFASRFREKGFYGAALTQCNSIEGLLKYLWQLNLDPNEDFRVYPMTHEHSIPGFVAGEYLATGRKIAAIYQNSGLYNAGDGFVSFAENYGIPLLAVSTFRGIGERSYPHNSIARRTIDLARNIIGRRDGVYGSPLGLDLLEDLDVATDRVNGKEKDKKGKEKPPQAILLLPGSVIENTLPKGLPNRANTDYKKLDLRVKADKGTMEEDYLEREMVSRDEALIEIMRRHPVALRIFCNGFTARAALQVKDLPGNFYNAAYMGGGVAIGYGAAISNLGLEVVVVDGDQNRQMGAAMNAMLDEYYPKNLHIYTLNNGGASSVNAAIPSVSLSYWDYDLTHVIETCIDDSTTFEHSRVEDGMLNLFNPKNAEILKREAGELKEIAKRVRRWMEQEGKDPVKIPEVFRESIQRL